MSSDYRSRIYESYITDGQAGTVGEAGLRARAGPTRAMIEKHFPDDRDAVGIDLGCGYGGVLYYAQREGYRNLRGVDLSQEQVDEAARLGVEGVSQGGLMDTLAGLTDSSQDLILAIDVLEHQTRDELIALVDEVFRVLRPGGRWLIKVPNGESPLFGRVRYGDLTHEIAFTRDSLPALLLASGFKGVECYEWAPTPQTLKSLGRWIIWKLIRGILRVYLAAESGDTGRRAVFTQNLLAVARK
ncbi:methyltransferase domain-containing protein [Myxococcota bacterium]|nr:methyltransferase domain-containing protein [Myxococcota bacterium]